MAAEKFIVELRGSAEYTAHVEVREAADPLILEIEKLPRRGMDGRLVELLTALQRKLREVMRTLGRKPATAFEALSIMGEGRFFAMDGILDTFNMPPGVSTLPPLPPKEELERHAARGHTLRLRTNTAGDGAPLTMEKMFSLVQKKFQDGGYGALLADPLKGKGEAWFSGETPRMGWVFTTDEVLPASLGKDFIGQTECIARYVMSLYDSDDMPEEYAAAIRQWNEKLSVIQSQLGKTANMNAVLMRSMRSLQLNRLRSTSADAFFDFIQTFWTTYSKDGKGRRTLDRTLTWTSTVHPSKNTFLMFGSCDRRGAMIPIDNVTELAGSRNNCGVALSFPYPGPFGRKP